MSRKLFICGDIHGKLKTLVWKLVEQKKITDADVIIVGDIGVGFGRPKSFEVLYKSVERRLERSNIKLWCIRGNHDDPSFFDGSTKYPYLELLPDHITVEVGDWKVYPVGGATSIDREDRLKTMQHSKYPIYWKIWEEILEDRKYLQEVHTLVRSGYWFFGHYHKSYCGESGLTLYRGLGELELFEVPGKIELP